MIVVLLVMLGSFRAGLIRAMAIPRDDLIAEMSERLNSKVPGVAFGFTQPIAMRVDELVAGVKADVAVLIYGDDLETLARLSKDLERTLRSIPGAADVKADYQANLTTVTIVPDRAALARYGIEAQQVMDVVEALGGREVGIIFEGRARFPIRVRIPDNWRSEIDRLKQLPVAEAGGKPVPLDELAEGQCSRASAKTANAIAGSNA